jgi:hypothetical protein
MHNLRFGHPVRDDELIGVGPPSPLTATPGWLARVLDEDAEVCGFAGSPHDRVPAAAGLALDQVECGLAQITAKRAKLPEHAIKDGELDRAEHLALKQRAEKRVVGSGVHPNLL